jgi:hypothetical protein
MHRRGFGERGSVVSNARGDRHAMRRRKICGFSA